MNENQNHEKEKKESLIYQIVEKANLTSVEELEHVLNVFKSLDSSKRNEGFHYFGEFLGIKKEDSTRFVMSLGLQNANTYGVVQGGAIYTLVDVAIGYTIIPKLKENEKVFTLELKLNFIKPGQGEFLIAKPEILHWGKNTIISQCGVYDGDENLVAQGLGTFFIKHRPTGGFRGPKKRKPPHISNKVNSDKNKIERSGGLL